MLVSIIIPCYNQGPFLNETLKSVQDQSFPNWECFIIDDGSTDNTELIGKEWSIRDERFIYLKQENKGVSAARNLGLRHAQGEWIQFLDADDYLNSSKLFKSLQALEKDSTINFIATNFRHFTTDVSITTPPFCNLKKGNLTLKSLLYDWNDTFSLPIHTVILRKELIGDTQFRLGLTAQEDWFFWVSIFKKECYPFFINEPLVLYRSHSSSRTKREDIIQDQIKAYVLFKKILTQKEYEKFSEVLMLRYLRLNYQLKLEKNDLKNSNSYQTGLMIKKIIHKIGFFQTGRKLFKYIRTFKKSNY